jgi:broad specificity phosphatase PhoE
VASGWLDPSLSEKGREQAAELGARRTDVDVVYTSDLKRAIETAEIAFGSGGFRTDARLRESDYGSMSGAPPAEIERERPDRIDTPFPDGESFRDVIERVRSFVEDITRDHEGERVLVIGHMATRVALDHLLAGVPLEEAVGGHTWQPGWEYST